MKTRSLLVTALGAVALIVAGAAAGRPVYRADRVQVALFFALTRSYVGSWEAPAGATTTERNPAYKTAAYPTPAPLIVASKSGRQRMAELQPDAHFGALFAARRDQRQDRGQA